MSLQPPTNQLIQKNKALLNASGFITFSKKTYTDLIEFYPHITKNAFPINIIKHKLFIYFHYIRKFNNIGCFIFIVKISIKVKIEIYCFDTGNKIIFIK